MRSIEESRATQGVGSARAAVKVTRSVLSSRITSVTPSTLTGPHQLSRAAQPLEFAASMNASAGRRSAGTRPSKSLRLGVLIGLAPRKLGSFEDWIIQLCAEARRRGHQLDLFGLPPIHPALEERLGQLQVGWKRWDVLKTSPVQSVRTLASYDVLHVNMFGAYDPICLMTYAAYPARVLFVAHADVPFEQRSTYRTILSRALKELISRRLDGLAGVSNYIRNRQADWFGMDERKTRTIYNGIDLNRFKSRRTTNRSTSGAVVLAVANLVPWKGMGVLLRAFSRVRDATMRLLIAGDGPEEKALKEMTRSLNLESRVSFLGLRDDVPELLDQADMLVHPATYGEPFGLTIAEAMAAERPVIASRVGGIPELIQDGINGLLVDAGDDSALGRAIDLLNEHPEYRANLARRAREHAVERFALDRCVQEHLDWCEELFQRVTASTAPGSGLQFAVPVRARWWERTRRSSSLHRRTTGGDPRPDRPP